MTTIGFVGVGTMGAPIARRLLAAGFEVRVSDQATAAAEALAADGAEVAPDATWAAEGAEVVLCSLPGPDEVREAVTGPAGVLAATEPPRYVVDLSTNAPGTVQELAAACQQRGVVFVDAPVSGGPAKAATGELSVMLGAEPTDLEALRPVLDAFATQVFRVGGTGAGTIAKLVNNQLFLAGEVLVQEAYLLAAALGLDPSALHPVIRASSAGPYAALAPLLLSRRFDDVLFRLDIAAKDLRLAVDAAERAAVDVPATRGALDVFAAALAAGDGPRVFHATLLELERRAGTEVAPLRREPG